MAASTRPFTLGEILDRTAQIYRRNFLLLAGIATPAASLIVLLSGTVVILFSSHLFALAQAGQSGAASQVASQDLLIVGLVFAGFLFIGIPIMLGIFSIAFAALTYASTEISRGHSVTIRSSYGFAFRHFWRHVGVLFLQTVFAGIIPYLVFGAVALIASILIALTAKSGAAKVLGPLLIVLLIVGVIALLVICVLIWLRLSLAYPASVAEDQKAWPSLKRSNQLTKGTRGRIFVMFLLVVVLSIVASMALMIPMDLAIAFSSRKSLTAATPPTTFLLLLQIANLIAGFLVRIFVMPIYTTALVLFYLDQRTRLEGYDIEQLMQQAGWSALPAAPGGYVPHPVAPYAYPSYAAPAPVGQAGVILPDEAQAGPPAPYVGHVEALAEEDKEQGLKQDSEQQSERQSQSPSSSHESGSHPEPGSLEA